MKEIIPMGELYIFDEGEDIHTFRRGDFVTVRQDVLAGAAGVHARTINAPNMNAEGFSVVSRKMYCIWYGYGSSAEIYSR